MSKQIKSLMEAYKTMKQPKVELEEKVKTTDQDPLILVHKGSRIVGHMNLSTAARIEGFDYNSELAQSLVKGGVGKKCSVKGSKVQVSLSDHHAKEVQESVELDEETKTFKSVEDWLMAVLAIKGTSVSMFGKNLTAQGLGRKQSATFELKKGRGSLVESVELEESDAQYLKVYQKIEERMNGLITVISSKSQFSKHVVDSIGPGAAKDFDKINKLLKQAQGMWLDMRSELEMSMDEACGDKKYKKEALDKVGKEDGDIDNDGDEDDSDKYLAKKRAAISKNMKEDSDISPVVEKYITMNEASLGDHQALISFAKENGGSDKGDMLKAAALMGKGDLKAFTKFVDDQDTFVQDIVLAYVDKKHLK